MHEDIKTYTLDGEVDDKNLIETKERLVDFMENMIREHGAVPVLDMEPQFTLDYKSDKELYEFKLTLYGVYVGKDEAWEIAGLMNGKPIMRHIRKPKSNQ
jgi:hypothetical protein